MCERSVGVAGLPANPTATVSCGGFHIKADFSADPMGYDKDTNRSDRIRPRYEHDTNGIRPASHRPVLKATLLYRHF